MNSGKVEETEPSNHQVSENNKNPTMHGENLSKRAIKKLARKDKWEEQKKQRRKTQRKKEKDLKILKKLGKITDPVILQRLSKSRKVLRARKMRSSSCKVAVAVDMSFDKYMNEKEIAKCVKQIHHCYSVNRSTENPMQFYVTSFTGASRQCIERNIGWENWDVNFTEKEFHALEQYPKDRVVYLSSESNNDLETLEDNFLYVIGGIVDHNSQKGLCKKIAESVGVKHAKLPIEKHVELKARKVLTINHVLHSVCHDKDWKSALLEVIPSRKNPIGKHTGEDRNIDEERLEDDINYD